LVTADPPTERADHTDDKEPAQPPEGLPPEASADPPVAADEPESDGGGKRKLPPYLRVVK
jgi:hypothetical protein